MTKWITIVAATALFAVSYNIPDFRVHLLPSFVAVALLAGAAFDSAAVAGDTVQADHRRSQRISPLRHAQLHDSTSFPKCDPVSSSSRDQVAFIRRRVNSSSIA